MNIDLISICFGRIGDLTYLNCWWYSVGKSVVSLELWSNLDKSYNGQDLEDQRRGGRSDRTSKHGPRQHFLLS